MLHGLQVMFFWHPRQWSIEIRRFETFTLLDIGPVRFAWSRR